LVVWGVVGTRSVGFARYTCTGQGSGFSPCANQAPSGNVDWVGAPAGDSLSLVVPFNADSGDVARVRIHSSPGPPGPDQSYVYVKVYHADGTSSCNDMAIYTTGHANGNAWSSDGLFTATSVGNAVSVFLWVDKVSNGNPYNQIVKIDVGSNCGLSLAMPLSATDPKNLTAGTEQDGGAMYLFYVETGIMKKARALLGDSLTMYFVSESIVPALSSYTNPCYVTAAQSSSHYIPILFTRESTGQICGSTGTYNLYYVGYPLPLDGEP